MAKSFAIEILGLGKYKQGIQDAKESIHGAVMHGLGEAAKELEGVAQQAVSGSQYDLSHDSWQISSRMSRKYYQTALVGYYGTIPSEKASGHWNMKFFERGTKERFTTGNGKKIKIAGLSRGVLKGGYFMKTAAASAEGVAQRHLDESIQHLLQKCGLE